MTNKRFAIIGGGIAGLTAAIALNKIGIYPEIFESAPAIRGIGAGLVLAANAIKGFQRLEIADEVIQLGRLLSSFTLYDEKGKEIIKTNSKEISKKYGADNFTISRATLHKLLLSKLDPARIHPGKQVYSLEKRANAILLKFNDNTSHETDFVVAADGIHSAVRKKLLPEALTRYAGYTCWRAIIEDANLNLAETSETWGTKGRFGIVPLTGNKIYWFACINAPENDRKMKEMKTRDLANIFKDYHKPIPEILSSTKDENVIWNDIIDLKPTNNFAFGNIILIGDAAHATTPNLGQGACQAIEDAVVLADELHRNSDYVNAFKKFEQRRIKRTRFIVNRSWSIGKMAQTDNKVLAEVRNFIFRHVPAGLNDQQIRKLYQVDF
jgi:2-polyprenyl-6-methoxyphenol hydroxylase-like FAD-dependent oxidoreductase